VSGLTSLNRTGLGVPTGTYRSVTSNSIDIFAVAVFVPGLGATSALKQCRNRGVSIMKAIS
jgi:hypothetical protein